MDEPVQSLFNMPLFVKTSLGERLTVIGNVQFYLNLWQFCTLDGVLIIASKDEFYFKKSLLTDFQLFVYNLNFRAKLRKYQSPFDAI